MSFYFHMHLDLINFERNTKERCDKTDVDIQIQ